MFGVGIVEMLFLLCILGLALYWIVRTAVRGGVLDALRKLEQVEQPADTSSDLRRALEDSRRTVD